MPIRGGNVWGVLTLVAAVVLVVFAIGIYNRLVRLRNRVEEGWAGIDVQLQRRTDLVPNLVEAVAGYATHERALLDEVTRARSRLVAAQRPVESGAADDELERALGRVFAVAESYPDLQASHNFLRLQRDLVALEEEISFARRYYNAVVEDLNTGIQSFPSLLVARPFGFVEGEYFKAEGETRAVPPVTLEGSPTEPPAGDDRPGP